MDWTRAVDGYCERTDASFWSEPLNAVTNLAFIVVALWLWPRSRGMARVLCAVLMAIGVGSFLFHTFAQPWAGVLDVVPILVFILLYIYMATRDFLGQPKWIAFLAVAAFFPFAAVLTPLFRLVPGLGGSAAYAPVPVMIVLYAALLRTRNRPLARGLLVGASALCLSIIFRALDSPLCESFPLGTHLLWHLCNAGMLGWMIGLAIKNGENGPESAPQR